MSLIGCEPCEEIWGEVLEGSFILVIPSHVLAKNDVGMHFIDFKAILQVLIGHLPMKVRGGHSREHSRHTLWGDDRKEIYSL